MTESLLEHFSKKEKKKVGETWQADPISSLITQLVPIYNLRLRYKLPAGTSEQ